MYLCACESISAFMGCEYVHMSTCMQMSKGARVSICVCFRGCMLACMCVCVYWELMPNKDQLTMSPHSSDRS